jgi:hypothetical protein
MTAPMKLDRCLPRVVPLFAAVLCWMGPLAAQEKEKEQEPKEAKKQPEIEIPGQSGMQAAQEEMIKLFHEVERTLGAIDLELADAGAGRIPAPEGKDSGIERLLRSHGEKSDQAVAGIERILELAEQLGKQSGSQCMKASMNAPPEQSGQSPLDKERQRGPTQGEKTPEAPKPKDGQKPESQQPQGEKPDDKGPNPPPGENRPSPPRIDEAGQPFAPGTDAERWGNLPLRWRKVFQNQITDDTPLQYRDWIDAYYRRLSKTR